MEARIDVCPFHRCHRAVAAFRHKGLLAFERFEFTRCCGKS